MSDLLLGLIRSLAVRAFEHSKELDPVQERSFVVDAARKLVEAVRYYEKEQEKRQRMGVWP